MRAVVECQGVRRETQCLTQRAAQRRTRQREALLVTGEDETVGAGQFVRRQQGPAPRKGVGIGIEGNGQQVCAGCRAAVYGDPPATDGFQWVDPPTRRGSSTAATGPLAAGRAASSDL